LLKFRGDDTGSETHELLPSQVSQYSRIGRGNLDTDQFGHRMECKWKRVSFFYKSPAIIFSYNCITYLFFLLLFSYVVLDYHPDYSEAESVLAVWIGILFIEEIRQAYKHGSEAYFSKTSNWLDLIGVLVFFTALGLQNFDDHPYHSFETSKYLMCLSMTAYYFRLFDILSVVKQIGPMIIMIRKMVLDLVFFLLFIAVFIVAYGVVYTSILYPNHKRSGMLVYTILRAGYWSMLGEIQTYLNDDLETNETCTYNSNRGSLDGCSNAQLVMSPLMAVYILFINVLMFNVLIALISQRFQETQEESQMIWSFQRYWLLKEYIDRPPPPLPFSIFCHVPQFIHFLLTKLVLHLKKPQKESVKRFLEFRWPWEREIKAYVSDDHPSQETNLSTFECRNAERSYRRRQTEPPPAKYGGIRGQLEKISMEIRGQENYAGLRSELKEMRREQTEMRHEQTQMRHEQTEMRREQTEMRSEQTEMRREQTEIRREIT
jgi:hypothetical protein